MAALARVQEKGELFTVQEAAYLSEMSAHAVHRAIDREGLGRERRNGAGRRIDLRDVVVLRLLGETGRILQPAARRALRDRVRASEDGDVELGCVVVQVAQARRAVTDRLRLLERARRTVVSDPDIRGGEPVVQGTRVPVHVLAELRRQGVPIDELLEDYPRVNRAKLEAALAFAQAYPRRGRRPRRILCAS